jgi:hypothetical protein
VPDLAAAIIQKFNLLTKMKKAFFSFRKSIAVIGTVVLVAGLLSACNKKDAMVTRIPASGLMAFNLAPDKDGIGIALSGNLLNNTPLGYTDFNGMYQNIYTGTRDIKSFDLRDSVFASSTFTFEDGNYYSLFITGNNGVYKNITVKDDIDSSATADKAYIRYINAIPDSSAPVVSISSGGTSVSEAQAAFNTVSNFISVSAGDVKIAVSNGSDISTDRTLTLENGKVYTALIVGVPGATDNEKKLQIRYVVNGLVPAATAK